jgi:hypothetical protein
MPCDPDGWLQNYSTQSNSNILRDNTPLPMDSIIKPIDLPVSTSRGAADRSLGLA